jgi:hypothetical protein
MWAHLPVKYVVHPSLGDDFFARFERWVAEAIEITHRASPDAFTDIPNDGFVLWLRWSHGSIYANLRDLSLTAPSTRREHRDVASTGVDVRTDEQFEANPCIAVFAEIAKDAPKRWAGWLEWRRVRRGPKPEWLLTLEVQRKAARRPAKTSGKASQLWE